jgi:hypothetical protein
MRWIQDEVAMPAYLVAILVLTGVRIFELILTLRSGMSLRTRWPASLIEWHHPRQRRHRDEQSLWSRQPDRAARYNEPPRLPISDIAPGLLRRVAQKLAALQACRF